MSKSLSLLIFALALSASAAGVRRKARVEEALEKFSVIKTLQSIAAAQVVVVLVDARENLAEQDLSLIGYALDEKVAQGSTAEDRGE